MKWCLTLLLALALALGALPGCAPPRPSEQALIVHAFDGLALALVTLDAVQASRLAAMRSPTTEEVEAEADRVRRLRRARDALKMARSSFGRDDALMRERALIAVALLEAVAAELAELGHTAPEAYQALAVARTWLESAP